MIVPMKKVSIIVLNSDRKSALKKLRKLGLLHIEIKEGKGARLLELQEQISKIERGAYAVADKVDKNTVWKQADVEKCLEVASKIDALFEEQKRCRAEVAADQLEWSRLQSWGEIDLEEIAWLKEQGISVSLHEMQPSEYDRLGENTKTVLVNRTKDVVRFLLLHSDSVTEEDAVSLERGKVKLPRMSTKKIKQNIANNEQRIQSIEEEILDCATYVESMKESIAILQKEMKLETYATGMEEEVLSEGSEKTISIAYFVGFLPAEDLEKLQAMAKENAWGLLAEDPTEEDDAPTKLQNNKFVSLVYPLTDFLGSMPGYFEPDISTWFLIFIMIFVGIIFGDGGYGLLICGVAVAMIVKSRMDKKPVAPMAWLLCLLGGATLVWGTITCTWFGLDTALLPEWLKKLSIPVISNVYGDKLWQPFWVSGEVGLTTSQNVQIVCFTIALAHLMIAHINGVISNRKSLKLLGDVGSILQLLGMYYVVLSLVVNSQVFGLGLVIYGIPVGTIAIACVGIGFVVNFVFTNYEGHIGKAIIASLTDIVSMLLGVVNVFSDIVSYIRLWAVGLAGAAISATVNDLVSPMLGHFLLIIFAVIVLVFGHGLNMILNVLSVIVHGIRLNTLEFSTHVGLSWSGHKYEPFEEGSSSK